MTIASTDTTRSFLEGLSNQRTKDQCQGGAWRCTFKTVRAILHLNLLKHGYLKN